MADKENRKSPPTRRRRKKGKQVELSALLKKHRSADTEFKPDRNPSTWMKTARLTRQQRLRLTKWALYALTVMLCLVIQDVVLARLFLFGATADLAVCAIAVITVLEGTEAGSVFVLLASLFYYFSGSAPTAWCVGLLTFLGTGATLFRQMYWHRSKGSVILCAWIATASYEMGLFVVGLMQELTIPSRIGYFGLTILYSCIAIVPLYSLIYKIGLIGGNTWKE